VSVTDTMHSAQQRLIGEVKKLFAEKKIEILVGFEKGTLPGRTRPCIIRSADEANRLVWDNTCSNNLAGYLVDLFAKKPPPRGQPPPPPPKVGIVLKGCDALSVALLAREKQVPRECLTLISMPCQGIANPETGEIFPSCQECANPIPADADVRIPGESRKPVPVSYSRIEEFEKLPKDERWRRFVAEVSKCIRCYACREVCPNCYCKECFAEKTNPRWIGVGNDLSDTMLYQIGRMFHQAGRCVACDACVRACPMGVDLRTFTRKLAKDARELFEFDIGSSKESESLLSTFTEKDSDGFITNPDKQK
jgi:formate dehydrogenase (coenzyme F420) beta subunit